MEVANLISLLLLFCGSLTLAYRVGKLQQSIEGRLEKLEERSQRHEQEITYLKRYPPGAAHAASG